ncbi:MAG: hypothetical protein L6Q54_12005 [Leptospiraceae bacterium]|nr:hypothetical protein [Leptospiraceae bacterium]MCK6381954.1 hypothetical protein [Leptospiraceae bacterium]NUM40292.1 hypothetical protein [Leptospiraceae bacterium]
MKRNLTISIIILFVAFYSCSENKSQTKEKRIEKVMITYLLSCTGGSLEACRTGCGPTCGIPVGSALTAAALPCVTSCQSTCSSNCDLTTSLGVIIAQD